MNKQRKCKCILLSEKSQSEKGICCIIPIVLHSGKKKRNYVDNKINGCFKGLKQAKKCSKFSKLGFNSM